jgi:hypothetical protein
MAAAQMRFSREVALKGKGKKRYKEPMLSLIGVENEYGKEGRRV